MRLELGNVRYCAYTLYMLDAQNTFEDLKSLVGHWHGTNEDGNPVQIHYYLTANATTLVEDWTFHNGMTAPTLFHLDGDALIAAHFCPLGNQPRLKLNRAKASGILEFEFWDITNLSADGAEHCHAFDMELLSTDTFRRNENYICAGVQDINGTTFTRVS